MNSTLQSLLPYIAVLLGLLFLFYLGMAIPAGVCFLVGIVMIIERKWPEKWQEK